MAKKRPFIINASDLMQEEVAHAYMKEGTIVLPMFRFPEHWMIQDWLNNTEYGEAFTLTLLANRKDRVRSPTVPGLIPRETKQGFKWALRGDAGLEELEEIILDYAKNLQYNM